MYFACITDHNDVQANYPVSSVFVMVSENICTICLENFPERMESVSPQYGCFLKLVSFLMTLVWKTCHSCGIIAPVENIVVIQLSFKIVKIAKGLFAKKCTTKIVNCYRMFVELYEALAGGRALDEAKDFKRSRPRSPSTASPRCSIPVRGFHFR